MKAKIGRLRFCCCTKFSTPMSIAFIFLFFALIPSKAYALSAEESVFEIGAILDEDSPLGKEERAAMLIAVQTFNNISDSFKLNITFRSPSRGILPSSFAAEELIYKKKVNAIIGMNRWEEAAGVVEIGSRAKIPIVSFSSPAKTFLSVRAQWPFMVSMANDATEQMKCIASILRAYNWGRIVPVFEENLVGGSSAMLSLLAEEIRGIGAEIEFNLAIPPFYTLSNAEAAIEDHLKMLADVKARVFIVLEMSLPMAVHLFRSAKDMGLMEANNVWILSDSVASCLDLLNTSVIYTMEGVLGVRNHYPSNSIDFHLFQKQFRRTTTAEYPDDEILVPGFNALRAYDSITTIIQALKRSPESMKNSNGLLDAILSADFHGKSGRIIFQEGKLSNNPVLRVVNVVGKRYQEIDFWIPGYGFSKNLSRSEVRDLKESGTARKLKSRVIWPGDPQGDPKGWAMPTTEKKMKIGVPGRTVFGKFVKVVDEKQNKYDGFCIDLFHMVLDKLGYPSDIFTFIPYNGTYSELVNHVYNKTFDGIVGDVTILSERLEKVQFTMAYLESGLSMIVPAVSDVSSWMFLKPFTAGMWMVSGIVLVYTTFVVWFMERQTSPELGDTWKDQLGNAVMFTLSSLFFVQREKLYNQLTRVVLIVWLCLVLVLNSSYTASLSSMLTARQLRPSITDIKYLVDHRLKVGCDPDSFLYHYLQELFGFNERNIVNITGYDNISDQIKNGDIAAAFVETPYKTAFFNQFCLKDFAETTYNYRFGGFAFAFEIGSPIALEFSKGLLELEESGKLKDLEDRWFAPSDWCTDDSKINNGNLGLQSVWALYVISGATSTICLLLFSVSRILQYRKHMKSLTDRRYSPSKGNGSFWERTVRLASFIYYGEEAIASVSADSESYRPESEGTPSPYSGNSEIEVAYVPPSRDVSTA